MFSFHLRKYCLVIFFCLNTYNANKRMQHPAYAPTELTSIGLLLYNNYLNGLRLLLPGNYKKSAIHGEFYRLLLRRLLNIQEAVFNHF
jgi:hypothetical protein